MNEYQHIVEFSYQQKEEKFVVRFLDGSSYSICVEDLPKRLKSKKPKWEEAALSDDRTGLIIKAGTDTRIMPSHIIHSRGNVL